MVHRERTTVMKPCIGISRTSQVPEPGLCLYRTRPAIREATAALFKQGAPGSDADDASASPASQKCHRRTCTVSSARGGAPRRHVCRSWRSPCRCRTCNPSTSKSRAFCLPNLLQGSEHRANAVRCRRRRCRREGSDNFHPIGIDGYTAGWRALLLVQVYRGGPGL